jgi:hypothetical protein
MREARRSTTVAPGEREGSMSLVILVLLLALIFGGVGLFVSGLKWVLIIAAVLFVMSLVMGWSAQRRA